MQPTAPRFVAPRFLAFVAVLSLALLVCAPDSSEAWGFLAHRRITAAAVRRLPPPLQRFFASNLRTIAEHSVDPDLWRRAGMETESPNHYLDIDEISTYPFDDVPHDEDSFRARFGARALVVGRIPYRIGEVFARLVDAMRRRDGAEIRQRSAVLAHYVADLHVPLHVTRNHDGQETGQEGLHRRWETELTERYSERISWDGEPGGLRTPDAIDHPVDHAFEILKESYLHVEELLRSDRMAVGDTRDRPETPFDDRYDAAYFDRFFAAERERLQGRIDASVTAISRLWLGAWDRAGRPLLPEHTRDRFVRGESRAIVMTWDGAGERMVERLLQEGKLPHLAELEKRGTAFDFLVSTFPAETAPAHAALYTGAFGSVNGITANEVPREPGSAHTVLEWESGYLSRLVRAEPFWVAAAREGLRSVVMHTPLSTPFEPYLSEKRFGASFEHELLLLNGYDAQVERDRVFRGAELELSVANGWTGLPDHHGPGREFRLDVWGKTIHGVLVDTVSDPREGVDRMVLAPGSKSSERKIVLDAREPGGSIPSVQDDTLILRRDGGRGGVFFRLFELSPDGSDFLLYQSRIHIERVSLPDVEERLLESVHGFQGNGPGDVYERGALGPTLMAGGDGHAERRYLDILSRVYRQFTREAAWIIKHAEWDLIFQYLPFPDETAHLWYGFIDPSLPTYRPEVGERLQEFLEEVCVMNDRFLGTVLERLPPETIVVLTSDHGMAGSDRIVHPNVALRQSGLLSVLPGGDIDLRRSKIVYQPEETAFLRVNRMEFEQGVVPLAEVQAVVRAARRALASVRDPDTHAPVFTAFSTPSDMGGLGGGRGGDLYMELAPGYRFGTRADGAHAVRKAVPRGTHAFSPIRSEMHAILYMAGPGVPGGHRASAARVVDIAPTIAHLLGIGPPRQSQGRVLEEAVRADDSFAP